MSRSNERTLKDQKGVLFSWCRYWFLAIPLFSLLVSEVLPAVPNSPIIVFSQMQIQNKYISQWKTFTSHKEEPTAVLRKFSIVKQNLHWLYLLPSFNTNTNRWCFLWARSIQHCYSLANAETDLFFIISIKSKREFFIQVSLGGSAQILKTQLKFH